MLSALALALVLQSPDPADLAKKLTDPSRDIRVEALGFAEKLDPLPEQLIPPLIEFAKLDSSAAMSPKPSNKKGKARPSTEFKLNDGDTSLTRIKASPADYVGREFSISAAAQVSDYYNFSFRDEGANYFSIQITGLGKASERAHAYLPRDIGAGFMDKLTETAETGAAMAVRLRCTIPPHKFMRGEDEANALDLMEVTDWATGNDRMDGFGPWAMEPTRRATAALAKAPGGGKILAEILGSESELGDPRSDLFLRTAAAAAFIRHLDTNTEKAEITASLRRSADKIRSGRLPNKALIVTLIAKATAMTQAKAIPSAKAKPQPKPVDPEARAASLLKLGDNLAKAGKAKAATPYYREILSKYPSTKAAATARQRLGR